MSNSPHDAAAHPPKAGKPRLTLAYSADRPPPQKPPVFIRFDIYPK